MDVFVRGNGLVSSGSATVTTTAAILGSTSPTTRTMIVITNLSANPIYIGFTSSVSSSSYQYSLASGAVLSLGINCGIPVYAIAASSSTVMVSEFK